MRPYLPKAVKKMVKERASFRCEYCRVPEFVSSFDFHIDHIVGLQHGGPNTVNNLAFCYSACNWKKGSNIATILKFGGELIPLFNPRKQNWLEHFTISMGKLISLSLEAEATIKLLELNTPSKIEERTELIIAGIYP